MTAALDVNVLVYASLIDSPEYERANGLLQRLVAGPELLYLFWPVLLGYMRIATNPAILSAAGTPAEIADNIGQMLARPHVRAPGEAPGFWEIFRGTAGDHTRGDLVTDAHIAALMRQHGVRRIYTRDRDFRRFDGIEPVDPFA